MNVLKLQNSYSWLVTQDQAIKDLLWKSLRFLEKNYFMNPLYKQRKWSGHRDFFIKESGRFLTGLLPEVELALRNKGMAYTIVDERGDFEYTHRAVDDQFLNRWLAEGRDPVTMHDYQVEYINQIAEKHRGIVRAPTSAGKTFVLVGALKCLPPRTPTLVMTKSTDLCRQIYDDIAAWNFEGLGKCIGSRKKDFCPNVITVANVDSVHKIDGLLPHFKALFVDEVHTMTSNVPKAVYKRMKGASTRIGISATPFKFGETDKCQKYDVKGFFGPIIKCNGKELTIKELQDRGILSPSRCVFYPIDEPSLPYETYQDAVTLGIAENIPFHRLVARLAKKLKGRTLIIVERIAHGEMLHQMIPGSHWIYGEDTAVDRKTVIGLLQKSDKCTCIVQEKLISAGINVFVHNVIAALGGSASHHVTQRVGRGLRRADDKDMLNYYDFVFNINDYLYSHSLHRMKVLRTDGHEVVEKDEVDF